MVVAILTQALAFAESGALAVIAAVTAGRVAAVLACRRSVPAAADGTLAARVANTQPVLVVACWVVAVAALAVLAGPRRGTAGGAGGGGLRRGPGRALCDGSAESPATSWARRSR